MANLFAQNSANWDSANMWNTVANGSGSYVTPGASDVCMANGKAIAINISVTCSEIRYDTTGGATSGGSFVLSDGVTLTSNIVGGPSAVTTTLLSYSGSSPNAAYIVGNITPSGANTLNLIRNLGTGTLTFTGNIPTSGVTGGNTASSLNGASSGTLNVTGNVVGFNGGTTNYGVLNSSSGSTTITGNVTGGSGSTNYGVSNSSTGAANITGTITAGGGYGCYHTGSGTSLLDGSLVPTSSVSAVYSGTINTIITSSITMSSAGWPAVFGAFRVKDNTPLYMAVRNQSNDTVKFYTQNYVEGLGYPTASNVRSGIAFGIAELSTGTLAVPPAGSVTLGVPVDNTTGTAVNTQETISQVVGAIWAQG